MSDAFKRLLRNASYLVGGNAVGAVLALVSLLMATRYLGAEGLGTIVLVQVTGQTAHQLFSFASWRTVIKYGADAEVTSERALAEVIKFGTLLDVVSVLIGTTAAVIALLVTAEHFEWDASVRLMSMLYCAGLLTRIKGASIGVLRMFDRFDVFLAHRVVHGVTRTVGVALAWALDLGAVGVLSAWIIAEVVGNLTLIVAAIAELSRRRMTGFWRASLQGVQSRHPGILRFSVLTNMMTGLYSAANELDSIIIGVMLSEEAVGIFQVVKQFGQVVSNLRDPLIHATYPDLSRSVAARDYSGFIGNLRDGLRLATWITVPTFVGLVLFGRWGIRFAFGAEFEPAFEPMLWFAAGTSIGFLGFALPSALQALGRPASLLVAATIAAAVSVIGIIPLIHLFELVGAGVAYLVRAILNVGIFVALLVPALRQWDATRGSPAEDISSAQP